MAERTTGAESGAPPGAPYAESFLEHYRRPRNLGAVEEPDGVALVREDVCGDILRLSLRVRESRVVEARFKAFGCAAAVAVGSAATVLLEGATLEAADRIDEDDLDRLLGGIPPARRHAAVLGREAIARAVAMARQRA